MEGVWKRIFDAVVEDIRWKVQCYDGKYILGLTIGHWRLQKQLWDGKYCWDWISWQDFTIDQELEMNKRKE